MAKSLVALVGLAAGTVLALAASRCGASEHIFAILASCFVMFLVLDMMEN